MIIDPSDCSSIFHSKAMQEVIRSAERIAATDVAVLLTGESGTGKELIADLIHLRSGCPPANISRVNCSSLELNHLERAYHDAQSGTLFLRDLCEMPTYAQGTLLSLLDQQAVKAPTGANRGIINARIIAATNCRPEEAIRKGLLEALYHRLFRLHLPALRERREDVMPLANTFLKALAAGAHREIIGFTPAAVDWLTRYDWPGNISQLKNEVEHAVLLGKGDQIDVSHFSIASASGLNQPGGESQDTNFTFLEGVERNAIVQMLKETGGNKLETAKRLGIGRQTLYNKIKAYSIEV